MSRVKPLKSGAAESPPRSHGMNIAAGKGGGKQAVKKGRKEGEEGGKEGRGRRTHVLPPGGGGGGGAARALCAAVGARSLPAPPCRCRRRKPRS